MKTIKMMLLSLLLVLFLCGCQNELPHEPVEACVAALEDFQNTSVYHIEFAYEVVSDGELMPDSVYDCIWVDGNWVQIEQMPTGSWKWLMLANGEGFFKNSYGDNHGTWGKFAVTDTDYVPTWIFSFAVDEDGCEVTSDESHNNLRVVTMSKDDRVYEFSLDQDGCLVKLVESVAWEQTNDDGSVSTLENRRVYSIISTDSENVRQEYDTAYTEATE